MKKNYRLITDPATGKSVYSKKRAVFLKSVFAHKETEMRILKMYGEFVLAVHWKLSKSLDFIG